MTTLDVLRIISPLIQLAICVLLLLSIVASITMRKAMDASRKALEKTIDIWNELYERSLIGAAMQTAPEAYDEDRAAADYVHWQTAPDTQDVEDALTALAEAPKGQRVTISEQDYLSIIHERDVEAREADKAEPPVEYDDIDMPHVDYLRVRHAEARERNKALITDWDARNAGGKPVAPHERDVPTPVLDFVREVDEDIAERLAAREAELVKESFIRKPRILDERDEAL